VKDKKKKFLSDNLGIKFMNLNKKEGFKIQIKIEEMIT